MSNNLKSSKALSIGEIVDGRTFRIPLYQRNYKWGKETAEKLATDLWKSYQKDDAKSIGLLTLHQSGDNEYYIIDGQQRFITLSIIFSLLLPDGEMPIKLSFDRDDADEKRSKAIHEEYRKDWVGRSTDEDRIMRNKEAIKKALEEAIKDGKCVSFPGFAKHIKDKCVMLCSVIEAEPEKEFMNLNAYKTKFSVCDYVRANLISLNTFCKKDLEEDNSILASCLEKYTYKTAVACLYDDILNILYSDMKMGKPFENVYSVVKGSYTDPDLTKESRINILFSNEKESSDTGGGYFSQEINKKSEEWIKILLKIACAKKLLAQLEQEMGDYNFSSAKKIDDYQKLKKENFLDLVMGIDVKEEGINTITLARLLKENSNVGHVLMKELGATDLTLANRYFESFVYSSINEATVTSAEKNDGDSIALPQMSDDEIISCIQGAGQYIIARFLDEQKQASDASVSIAPILDLEDRENPNFGGDLGSGDDDTIAVRELFKHNFIIPVIQRDYCVGARIAEDKREDDFLGYLLKNFGEKKDAIASTILVSVEKETNDIYVFDGQQRLYTIYQILKYCGGETDEKFTFAGRRNGPSKYSEAAVENLKDALKKRVEEKDKLEFRDFLYDHVKFKVKVTKSVSAAEQFFMDINGGVPLKNYEIFKSCLCERLEKLKKEDFIKKLENEWLSWFYRFLDIKNDDDSDKEELVEMRFIEFLCRFFIMRRNDSEAPLPAFDCIDSKSELVGKLGYINELTENDIENICKVMGYLTDHKDAIKDCKNEIAIQYNVNAPYKMSITPFCLSPKIESKGNPINICCYFLHQEDTPRSAFIYCYKNYILHHFIHSLTQETRERLENYYSWKEKDISALIKLYNEDLLIQDCIRRILGEEIEDRIYPYAQKKEIKMRFCGGYQTGVLEGPELIPEEEIPAYYVGSLEEGDYVRLNYLYDKVIEEHPELKDKENIILDFILTDYSHSIKKANDNSTFPSSTFIAFWRESAITSSLKLRCEKEWVRIDGSVVECVVKREIVEGASESEIAELNHLDAYSLSSKSALSGLIRNGFTAPGL